MEIQYCFNRLFVFCSTFNVRDKDWANHKFHPSLFNWKFHTILQSKSSRRVPGNTRRLPLHDCREHTGLGHVKLLAGHVERVGGVDLLAQRGSLQRSILGYLSMSFHMFIPSTFLWFGRGTICSLINRRYKPFFMFFFFIKFMDSSEGNFVLSNSERFRQKA